MAIETEGFDEVEGFFENLANTSDEEWWVGTIVEYAAPVEFGTSRQRAQPYLRPAVESVQAKAAAGGELDNLLLGDAEAIVRSLAFEVERRAKINAPVDTGNLMGSIAAAPSVSQMQGESRSKADFLR